MIDPKQFRDCGTYKYVLFNDGLVRFCDLYEDHESLSAEVFLATGAVHVKAGSIGAYMGDDYKEWGFCGKGSMSLGLSDGNDDDCRKAIEAALGPGWTFIPRKS